MDGPVTWPVLIFIVTVVVTSCGAACGMLMWVVTQFRQTRSALYEKIESQRVDFENKLDLIKETTAAKIEMLDKRAADQALILARDHPSKNDMKSMAEEIKDLIHANSAESRTQNAEIRQEVRVVHERLNAMQQINKA